mgnify:CR=1 FL=1
MKRFILFAWLDYEARGGLGDVVASADTPDELQSLVAVNFGGYMHESGNVQIVHRGSWEIVLEWFYDPHRQEGGSCWRKPKERK